MTNDSRQIYDPHTLAEEVAELLRERGLTTTTGPDTMGQAVGGAGMLLRAFGITPALDATTGLSRAVAQEPWDDHDR